MISSIHKLMSHAFSILVAKEKGEINPYLEVRMEGGKYVLNSEFGIGMGYVTQNFSKVGSEIYVQVRDKNLKAKVVERPFLQTQIAK